MTESQPLPLDQADLTEHVEFVRRLARGLVRDAAASEDLAQETWVAALERRGPLSGSLRAWLTRVLRNRAALALRRGERRARREAERDGAKAGASTTEIVERMELHGRVVAAVLALPESYREVVLGRYFRDESTHAIAARLGVPEATVRTRLARAQERLRQRLDAHLGGDRSHALLALADLARDGVAGPPPLLGPLATTATPLLMKKSLIALTVAILALVAVWSVARSGARSPLAEERAPSELAALPASLAAPEPVHEPAALPPPARVPAAETPAAETPFPSTESAPLAPGTAEPETAWLEFHVRDPRGNPIPEAKVSLTCYRTRTDPGSSISMGELMPVATTDLEGIARLEYPRRLDPSLSEPERPEIGEVCYTVTHPDFVAVEDWDFDVDESPAQVVLRHGALLIVAGFVGDRSELQVDVQPHLTDEVQVDRKDWVPVRDGRPSCNRLPPGRHALYLTRAGEGGTWASEVVEFELAEEEVRELTLELHPPRALSGRLDPLVPRPVRNGEVLLNLYLGRPEDRSGPRSMRLFKAQVNADGTFTLPGLPPGAGEMIGMCEGWISRSLDGSEEEGALELQQVDPSTAEPFVLAMEPTARLELLVLDPEGEPVEGAGIRMWPNVHWSIGYSQIFLDREWQAVSDASGRAEIANLPPTKQRLAVVYGDLCLPAVPTPSGVERRQAEAALVAGETTTLELRLEPCVPEKEGR